MEVRIPYLGFLCDRFATAEDELRRLITLCLTGASGYQARQTLVQALDDDDKEVRLAATDAAVEAAEKAWGLWLHLLYHPRADVRKRLLTTHAEHIPPQLAVTMLADDDHRNEVLALVDGVSLPPDALPSILGLWQSGIIERQLAARAVSLMPWDSSLEKLVDSVSDQLEYSRGYLPTGTSETDDFLEAHGETARDHGLEVVLRLFVESPSEPVDKDSSAQFFSKVLSSMLRPHYDWMASCHMALCVARLCRQRSWWNRETLTIAAVRFPALLAVDGVCPDLACETARGLAEISVANHCSDPLSGLADTPVCRTRDGAVDPKAVAGLLNLCTSGYFRLLEGYFTTEELTIAFAGSPEDALPLLAHRTSSKQELKRQTKLIRTVISARSPIEPRNVALLVLSLPHDALESLFPLDRLSSGLAGTVLVSLLTDLATELASTPEGRQERMATAMASQFAETRILATLGLVVPLAKDMAETVFLQAFFLKQVRECNHTRFLHATLKMTPEELVGLLRLVDATPGFPHALEWQLAEHHRTHEEDAVAKWASGATRTPARDDPARKRESVRIRPLSPKAARRIEQCPAHELQEALQVCYHYPTRGLCAALSRRTNSGDPSLEYCAALLVSFDSIEWTSDLFNKHTLLDFNFVEELDMLLAARCQSMSPMPFLGNAWLHRWDPRLDEFEHQVLTMKGGVIRALSIGSLLHSELLAEQVWRAVRRLLRRWRWRPPRQLAEKADRKLGHFLLEALAAGGGREWIPPDGKRRFPGFRETLAAEECQPVVADILTEIYVADVAPELMSELRTEVLPLLPQLSTEARSALSRWIDASGVPEAARRPMDTDQDMQEIWIEKIGHITEPKALRSYNFPEYPNVALAAAQRLVALGAPARTELLEWLFKDPPFPHLKDLALSVLEVDDPETRTAMGEKVADPTRHPAARFYCGVSLHAVGMTTMEPHLLAAANARSAEHWFDSSCWELLEQAGFEPAELSLALIASPHYAAYVRAVRTILDYSPPLAGEFKLALRTFLDLGTGRNSELRQEAAVRLKAEGDLTGVPTLLVRATTSSDNSPMEERLIQALENTPGSWVARTTEGLLASGDERYHSYSLLRLLRKMGLSPQEFEPVAEALLHGIENARVLAEVVRYYLAIPTRQRKLKAVAETFAWGIRTGQELAGKVFSIAQPDGGELAYTNLDDTKLYISPLPILRGERNARSVVRGLILHEIGHHLYHATAAGLKVMRQAREEELIPLLNLVADEHLERRLRPDDSGFDRDLKVLVAYAFQHCHRDLPAENLIPLLKGRTFPVLTRARLKVARRGGDVQVNSGRVLQELEAAGASFARFVRALRMGLGNRYGDDKVAAGLALFKKKFRNSQPTELLKIARRLREIFGTDAALLTLLGQDSVIDPHGADAAAKSDGISDAEIQEAVRRLLEGRKSKAGKPGEADQGAARFLNRGDDLGFEPILDVRRVPHDRGEHARYAAQTMRSSRQLRRNLVKLGMAQVEERYRSQGTRLDRTRVEALVLRGDPRAMLAHRTMPANDIFIGVLVDCSGSMSLNDNIEKAKLFATMVAEAARPVQGMDVRFYGFTDATIYSCGTQHRCSVHALQSGGGNNDAAALWHAAREARQSRRKSKLLVMISDGSPTECTVAALKSLVNTLTNRMKITCAQVTVHPLEEIAFPDYVDLSTQETGVAVRKFGNMIAGLIHKTLAGG